MMLGNTIEVKSNLFVKSLALRCLDYLFFESIVSIEFAGNLHLRRFDLF